MLTERRRAVWWETESSKKDGKINRKERYAKKTRQGERSVEGYRLREAKEGKKQGDK